jgi:DNA processing protein
VPWGDPVGGDGSPAPGRVVGVGLAAERRAWAVLASVGNLGPATAATLVRVVGSAQAVVELAARPDGVGALLAVPAPADGPRPGSPILEPGVAAAIAEATQQADRLLAAVEAAGLAVLVIDDPAYPRRLRAIDVPPPVLFVRGSLAALDAERAVAVVGTRRPTDSGRRTAAAVAGALARAGAVVVSGLAVGIDGAAHAASMAEGGRTVAVLGGGHERLYPRSHVALAAAIVDTDGAVVSELPPGAEPTRWQFPRRNRIISGLSEATVVVEAAPGSGALVTATWALDQGRECFLVPGPLGARASAGCLAFLREHHGLARIVAGIPELLDDLALAGPALRRGPRPGPPSRAAILAELGETERAVAAIVAEGPTTVDGIVAATGLSVAAVLGTISLLEARGLVGSGYGRYVPIGRLASAAPR